MSYLAVLIESNIKFGDENITDEEMKTAAEIAQATEFILAKEEKYNSEISQGGSNVSGGQNNVYLLHVL